MTSPLKDYGGLLSRRLNRTLHGRSVYRRQDVPGHNVVHGYNNPGTGDAVDFFGPKGEPVYAAHDGTIRRIADPGGKLSCLYINGNHVLTVYAHVSIKPGLRLGSLVKEGQVIGWIGKRLRDPHLHFECWLNGKALTGRTPGEVARKMAGALGD